MRTELTVRQRKFVTEYLKTGNGTGAAKAAGYQGNSATLAVQANRLLRNSNVQEALVAPLIAQDVTKERIVEGLASMAFMEVQDRPRFEHKLRALELLAKHRGMFKESEQSGVLTTIQILQITNEIKEEENHEKAKRKIVNEPPSQGF